MTADDSSTRFSFPCPKCEKRLKAESRLTGRKVSCPGCGETLVVPSAPVASESPAQQASRPRKANSSEAGTKPRKSNSTPARSQSTDIPADFLEQDATPPKASSPSAKQESSERRSSLFDLEDPFSLAAPAISDVQERDHEAREIRAKKEESRQQNRTREKNRRQNLKERDERFHELDKPRPLPTERPGPTSASGGNSDAERQRKDADSGDSIPFDSVDDYPLQPSSEAAGESEKDQDRKPNPKPDVEPADDDGGEFQLQELDTQPSKKSKMPAELRAALDEAGHSEGLGDLNSLVPDLSTEASMEPAVEDVSLEDAEYRITCSTCGTAQYVTKEAKGTLIECPDCFSTFKVPPPPSGWKPKRSKSPSRAMASPMEVTYTPTEEVLEDRGEAKRRARTHELLEKAKGEISDEERERLYDHDFDNADFLQRTFGFLRDPMTMAQIAIFGILFAGIFAAFQFGLNNRESQFGKGALLLTVVFVPFLGLLFALPMLSGALALIETVANKQKYVREIPAFNVFDNFADLLVITIALAASATPGFIVASIFAGEEVGAGFIKLGGTLISGYLFFPILLLSMMDNGTLFAPISSAVVRSFRDAADAWGGYYLKTLVANFIVLILWLLLLGRSPMLAAAGGFLFPVLIFFTCQQIGALADSIGDNLGFDFAPAGAKEHEESERAEDAE